MRRSPQAPFPGANPAADPNAKRGLVVARYAECYLFGAVVANLFDWDVKPIFDFANLTAHGDYWQVNAFVDAGWTARARGYLSLLGATYLVSATTTNGVPLALTFTAYSTLGNATGGSNPFKVWEGACFIKDANLLAPMAMFEQEITVIGTGKPSAGITP